MPSEAVHPTTSHDETCAHGCNFRLVRSTKTLEESSTRAIVSDCFGESPQFARYLNIGSSVETHNIQCSHSKTDSLNKRKKDPHLLFASTGSRNIWTPFSFATRQQAS